jgi:hypothetical protein
MSDHTEQLKVSDLYDPDINDLLKEFKESRSQLSSYIEEVDEIRSKVGDLFPKTQDFRNKFVLEEKIKATSSFFSMILNIRQEYNKSIKEEIEMRRKLFDGVIVPTDDAANIRDIASAVEDHLKSEGVIPSSDDSE